LAAKTQESVNLINSLAPDRLVGVVQGVEVGRLYFPRPNQIKAALLAKQLGAWLVASDLSRFVRGKKYDRRHNVGAVGGQMLRKSEAIY
jgi:hypothetical protein